MLLPLLAAALALAACKADPNPLNQPRMGNDGKLYYPPASGWPQAPGGESGGSGGGRS